MAIKVKHEGNVTSRVVAANMGGQAESSQKQALAMAQKSAGENAAANRQLQGARTSANAAPTSSAQLTHASPGSIAAPTYDPRYAEFVTTGVDPNKRPDDLSEWNSNKQVWQKRQRPGDYEAITTSNFFDEIATRNRIAGGGAGLVASMLGPSGASGGGVQPNAQPNQPNTQQQTGIGGLVNSNLTGESAKPLGAANAAGAQTQNPVSQDPVVAGANLNPTMEDNFRKDFSNRNALRDALVMMAGGNQANGAARAPGSAAQADSAAASAPKQSMSFDAKTNSYVGANGRVVASVLPLFAGMGGVNEDGSGAAEYLNDFMGEIDRMMNAQNT